MLLTNLVQSLVSLLKVVILSKFFPTKPPTENGSCLILGNGPSAKETLSQFLPQVKKMTCVCVNLFASHSDFEEIKPKYYVLIDPAFYDPNNLLAKNLLNNLISKVSWHLILIVPYHFRKNEYFREKVNSNPNISPHYFNYIIVDGIEPLNYTLYELGLGMPLCQNVLVASIFQCVRMGFNEIYLTGADHSWHENLRVSDEDNTLYLHDAHFYGERKRNLSDEFGGNSKDKESQIAKQFISFYKVFKGHEKIANYALKKGSKIINISSHSNIDVYGRGKLEVK